ncbi:MAG: filamentous hemagglutinin N-terminal domain-containing protein [Sphingomonadales bacterium]|nr:filamentous hemagglutinin N-terminal domain-containing protein [Sphingomonadales bacterium]
MAIANRTIRSSMLLSTAMAAAFAVPGVAHAQLVGSGDLVNAVDSGGNGGQLTVVDVDATTTNLTVLSNVVVANWTRFNVPVNTTVNIAPDAGLAQATLVNRVIGPNLSTIAGAINAPDVNLWLINQNGILFGDGAAINSASFYASTVDVANQELFDFYEGTDLFGNGASTVNFSGSLGNAVRTNSPNVSFVTDGSLLFLSEQLTLNADFDAGSGTVSFVTAADIDVTFTPGSPLTFVVNAGTTVARGQTINGSVTGEAVDFAMFTAAGVTDAVLQVNAAVTATQAIATDSGIRLIADGVDTPILATLGGVMNSAGLVEFDVEGELRATQSITGSGIEIDATDVARLANLTATAGDVNVSASAINAGLVTATGGGIFLEGTNGVVTGALDASGAINIGSAAGGAVNLASLDAGNEITITTSGRVTAGVTTAGGALQIGSGFNGPEAITLTGDVTAASVGLVSLTAISAQDIEATAGEVSLNALGGNLAAGDVLATGNITFQAPNANSAQFASLVSTGGSVRVQGLFPGDLVVTGETSGTSVSLTAVDELRLGSVTSTNGDVLLVSLTGSTLAGNVSATGGALTIQSAGLITAGDLVADGGDISLTAPGNITTGSITYKDRNGVPLKELTVMQVKDGKFTAIQKITPKWVPSP